MVYSPLSDDRNNSAWLSAVPSARVIRLFRSRSNNFSATNFPSSVKKWRIYGAFWQSAIYQLFNTKQIYFYTRRVQIGRARPPGRLNFVRCRPIRVDPPYVTSFMSRFCRLVLKWRLLFGKFVHSFFKYPLFGLTHFSEFKIRLQNRSRKVPVPLLRWKGEGVEHLPSSAQNAALFWATGKHHCD